MGGDEFGTQALGEENPKEIDCFYVCLLQQDCEPLRGRDHILSCASLALCTVPDTLGMFAETRRGKELKGKGRPQIQGWNRNINFSFSFSFFGGGVGRGTV